MCGRKDVTIQKRLLQEATRSFGHATNIALAMETAQHDAVEVLGQTTSPSTIHAISQPTKPFHKKPTKPHSISSNFPLCLLCGNTNHKRSDSYHRDSICSSFHKRDHIYTVSRSTALRPCHTEQNPANQKDGRKEISTRWRPKGWINTRSTYAKIASNSSSRKIMLDITIDNRPRQKELDTGTALSIMTIKDYKHTFQNETFLESTNI